MKRSRAACRAASPTPLILVTGRWATVIVRQSRHSAWGMAIGSAVGNVVEKDMRPRHSPPLASAASAQARRLRIHQASATTISGVSQQTQDAIA